MTYTQTEFTAAAIAGDAVLVRPQIAALCWRLRRGKVQVLLITSRETGRWIVPKGWLMDGRAPHEAAAVEAWEESGVRGTVDAQVLGQFTYDKLHPSKAAQRCEVTVYPLRVTRLEVRFPEKGQRRRKWFSAHKAARAVAEVALSQLILAAAQQLGETGKVAP